MLEGGIMSQVVTMQWLAGKVRISETTSEREVLEGVSTSQKKVSGKSKLRKKTAKMI